jgi:hypothetical protein
VLARGGQRALVRDNQRFALVDASTGKVLSDVVDVRAEDVQLSLDFDAKGQRAFALVGESIRELESGAAIDVGRLSAIARIFAVGDGDRLLVEANDALWLVPTAGGGGARRVASTSGGDVMRSVALDLERRHAAVVTWSDEEHSAVDVIDLATGDAARVLERRAYLDVIALASPATRIAVVEPIGDDGERSSLVVVDVASGKSLTQDAIPLGEEPIALAFSPDGNAVVARTPHALVRVGLEDVAAAPRVRYLRRASVVLETVPNWFDADDPKGERPRVIVIDETGRIALERVRFDDADVAPIVGASDALRAQWQRRLDLQIDGNGIAVPSSGSTGGGF